MQITDPVGVCVRGSIVARGPGKWLVRIWLGHDEAGRQQFHNKVVRGTRRDAEDYAADKISERNRRALPPTEPLTLGEYLVDWLENVAQPRLRASSYTSYVQVVDLYVPDELLAKRLQSVTTADLEALYASLRRRGLASRTVRYLHAILRSALKHARARRKIITQDPAADVQLPPSESKEMRALTWAEARALLAVLRKDEVAGLPIELMLVLGLRPSEVAGLRLEDVKSDEGVLVIAQRLVQLRGGGVDIGAPKSKRSARKLVLPEFLLKRLEQQVGGVVARMGEHAEWNPMNLLFPTTRGTAMNMRNIVKRNLRPALREAKIAPGFRLYDLRHAHATLTAAAGAPLRVVADQLGHANPAITITTYQHSTADMTRTVAGIFERMLEQDVGEGRSLE